MIDKVETLASHHKQYQKENDVPSQKIPVVVDVKRERADEIGRTEQGRRDKEQDREYEATVL